MFLGPAGAHLTLLLTLLQGCGGGSSSSGGGLPFRVDDIRPGDGSVNVSVNTVIRVKFSGEVSQTTVLNGVTFSLLDASSPGSPLPGTFSFDPTGKDLTFTPAGPLPFGATLLVEIAAGVEDSLGRPLQLTASLVPIPTTFDTQVSVDGAPPTFGGATGAAAVNDTSLQVDWSPASDNVDAPSAIIYNVYLATSSGGQTFSTADATSAAGATSEIMGGLMPSTTYFLVVRAEDSSGNEDLNLVEVTAATTAAPDVIPPVFGGVTSTLSTSPTEVLVTWNPASDDQASPSQIVYNIYVSTISGGQNFGTPAAVSPAGAPSHTVTGLSPDMDQFFVVRAVDPSGNEDGNLQESMSRTMVSFAAQVGPIFGGSCAFSSCHAPPTVQQGVDLSDYATISSTAIGVASNQAPLLSRIEPFDSAASYLVHKIDGTQVSAGGSGSQMPFGAPPLSQGNRDRIRAWVDQGALNN